MALPFGRRLSFAFVVRLNSPMPTARAFAERSVDLLTARGHRIPFRVVFGPIRSDGEEFRCKVRFHGWGNSPRDIRGYDSLQACTLAFELVYTLLVGFAKRGGRIVWPGTADDYDLSMFISHGKTAEPGTEPNRRQSDQRKARVAKKAAVG
jgi:hypothetical protein